ncbi:MAG: FHA domain-containing protein, partial [Victivallales bacterium]|nr:FHA domain-containing protein [Victivallales bacterium]
MRRLIVDTPAQAAALVMDLPEGDLEMTLGRHSESNIVLSGAGISRHHARLVQANGMLFIEDVGSSGGTFVNGEAIQAMTPLEENDVVTIGDNTLRIEDTASAANAAADEIPVEPTLAEPIAETPAPPPPQPAPVVAPPPSPEVNNFLDEFKNATLLYEDSIMELTKQIHTDILERLNLTQGTLDVKNDETMDRVSHVMDQILRERRHEIPSRIPLDTFRQALMDELI